MLCLPAISAAREAAKRMQCMGKLKQIGLALHLYHDAHGCFPSANVADKDGRPMHSWRTLIPQFMEGQALYNAYDFSKPWNDPKNSKLTGKSPYNTLCCPSSKNYRTPISNYVAVTGTGTIWDGDKSISMKDITDGTDNTILLVEVADSDIHWTEARDVTLEEALGKSNGGVTTVPSSNHYIEAGYFTKSYPIPGNIVMADGSVRCLHKPLSPDDLAALLSIDGGEEIDIDQLLEDGEYPLYQRLRWDHVIGLPLFLVSAVWFWYRLLQKPIENSEA
ncbi:MAG: DUF1559 domain-containing protein [Pirellulales bacterium]|nr:DUF1559 domain-containing protein [Pirellulales bacterium]